VSARLPLAAPRHAAPLWTGAACLPLPAAQWLWGGLQVLLALALYALPAADLLRSSRSALLLYTLLLATSLPLLHNFKWGPVSVLLTVGVLAALLLAERGRSGGGAA
jgi:hypothetical protein